MWRVGPALTFCFSTGVSHARFAPPAPGLNPERSSLRRFGLFIGALLVLLGACSDPQAPEANPPVLTVGQYAGAPDLRDTERDDQMVSPWATAADEELEAAVERAEGSVMIGFKNPTDIRGVGLDGQVHTTTSSRQSGLALLESVSAEIRRESVGIPAVVAVIDPQDAPALRAHPLVDYVEPGGTGGQAFAPDSMWAAEAIQAHLAWDSTTGSGVSLAILDTGVDGSHPGLNPTHNHDCIGTHGSDEDGHGSEVAGIAAAVADGVGMSGAAYGVELRSYRVMTGAGYDSVDLECGLGNALLDGVDVVNMSLGDSTGTAHPGVRDQILSGSANGVTFVAAAGNDDHPIVSFPANMAQVIAVVGLDDNLEVHPTGPQGSGVEFAAPGWADLILTTCLTMHGNDAYCLGPGNGPTNGEGNECDEDPEDPEGDPKCPNVGANAGSSYAAPLVSAAVALLKAHNPGWSSEDVRNRLRVTAMDLGTPGKNDQYGYGMVQALDALSFTLPPAPQVTISGPTTIDPHATCTWTAHATDGVEPLSYNWYVHSSSHVSTGPSHTGGEPGGNTGSDFNLFVVVTDMFGREAQDEIIIDLDPNAPHVSSEPAGHDETPDPFARGPLHSRGHPPGVRLRARDLRPVAMLRPRLPRGRVGPEAAGPVWGEDCRRA